MEEMVHRIQMLSSYKWDKDKVEIVDQVLDQEDVPVTITRIISNVGQILKGDLVEETQEINHVVVVVVEEDPDVVQAILEIDNHLVDFRLLENQWTL